MSQVYDLFKVYALAALEANDSTAALNIVNDPEGVDLVGTDFDKSLSWDEFRGRIGNGLAIVARSTIEGIASASPNPVTQPDEYIFSSNAKDALVALGAVGISPCDVRWRENIRAIVAAVSTLSDDAEQQAAIVEAFTAVLRVGYRSPAQFVLGRDATVEDFEEARVELAVDQQVGQGVEYNLRALQLSVNFTADGRKNVSCRVTPVAIVNGSQVKGDATAFSNQTPVNAKQQALIDAVLTAVDSYLE